MSVSSALERLATYRTNNTRASQETYEKGSIILKSGSTAYSTGDGWAFLEQLTLASIDVGRLDVADQCLKQLSAKFPGSPRVDILTGIRMEATESATTVLQYYNELLEADSSNAAAWKRRISVVRRMGRTEKTLDELSQYLDTFYTDVEGWLELADVYSSCNQYTSALQALSHALLLAPQNPFTALQFAETAYTADDLPLALKMFLLVVDMTERDDPSRISKPAVGISIRAWLGVKLCSRRLISQPSGSGSVSNTPVPKNIKLIDELATERVLVAYSTGEGGGSRAAGAKAVISGWVSGS